MTLYIITMMAKIDVVQHLGQVSHLAKAYFGFCGMTPVLVLLLLPLDAKLVHYMLPDNATRPIYTPVVWSPSKHQIVHKKNYTEFFSLRFRFHTNPELS